MSKTPEGFSWADQVEEDSVRHEDMRTQLMVAIDESGGEALPSWALSDLIEVVLPATGGNNTLLLEDTVAYDAAVDLINSAGMDLNDMSDEEAQYAKDARLLSNAQRVTYRYVIGKFLHPENVRTIIEAEQVMAGVAPGTESNTAGARTRPAPPSKDEYVIYAIQQSRGGKCLYVKYKSKHNGRESWSLPKRSFDARRMSPQQALEDTLRNDLGLPSREIASLLRNIRTTFELRDKSKVYHCFVLGLTGKMSNVNMYETANAFIDRISGQEMGNHILADLNGITCAFEKHVTGLNRCGGPSRGSGPRRGRGRSTGSVRGRRESRSWRR